MKNLTLVGLVMLGIGFGIGWIAKPAPGVVNESSDPTPAGKLAEQAASRPGPDSPPPGKHAIRDPEVKKPSGTPTEAQMSQAKKMQADMSKAMVDRVRTKFEARIESLAESLNLTTGQKDQLTSWLDGQMKELGNLDFTDPKAMADGSGLTKIVTEKTLDEQLASSLNEEQKEAFEEFKDREHRSKVDTAALKSLSKLQGIIQFDEGQRDEVYKVLSESAEANVLAQNDKPDVTKMFTDGMGIEMDPYDLGLTQAMTESMGNAAKSGETPGDQKQMAKNLREIVDKRIDAKVEELRPVLNDKQLDQYRNELKTKGLGIYGTMLMGMENGKD